MLITDYVTWENVNFHNVELDLHLLSEYTHFNND
jgi:hypothetical protein